MTPAEPTNHTPSMSDILAQLLEETRANRVRLDALTQKLNTLEAGTTETEQNGKPASCDDMATTDDLELHKPTPLEMLLGEEGSVSVEDVFLDEESEDDVASYPDTITVDDEENLYAQAVTLLGIGVVGYAIYRMLR